MSSLNSSIDSISQEGRNSFIDALKSSRLFIILGQDYKNRYIAQRCSAKSSRGKHQRKNERQPIEARFEIVIYNLIQLQKMGQSSTNPFRQGGQIMNEFTIEGKNSELFTTYLTHKTTQKEYLLRELTFNDLREFTMNSQKLKNRKNFSNQHITKLEKVEERSEDHMCSNFYKIYTLWEYPNKTLADEINDRALQKKRYDSKELYSILVSSVFGLAALQKNEIKHQCLTSKAILMSDEGNVKIVDPMALGFQNNIDSLYNNRTIKNIYLSPQQCESIESQKPIINKNPYKNDVFTLGMIMLECGLLERQDQCYLDDCSRINWQKIENNLRRLAEIYDEQLWRLIEYMLKGDIRVRPDWQDLSKLINSKDLKPNTQNNGVQPEIQLKQTSKRQTFITRTIAQTDHGKSANRFQPVMANQNVPAPEKNVSLFYGNQPPTFNQNPQPQKLYATSIFSDNRTPNPVAVVKDGYVPPAQNYYTQRAVETVIRPAQPIQNNLYNQGSQIYQPSPYQAPNGALYQQPYVSPIQSGISGAFQPITFSNANNQQFSNSKFVSNFSSLPSNSKASAPGGSLPTYQYSQQPYNQENRVATDAYIPTFPRADFSSTFGKQFTPIPQAEPKSNVYGLPTYIEKKDNSFNNTANFASYNPPQQSKLQQNKYQSGYNNSSNFDQKQPYNPDYGSSSPSTINNYIRPAQSVNYEVFKTHSPNESKPNQNKPSIPTFPFDPKLTKTPQIVDNSELQIQPQYVEEHFKLGSRYEGYKLNGLRHGKGKFYYQDGGSYDGEWKDNKMNGFGTLYYQSNEKAYEGCWVNDQFQGQGKLYNENPIMAYESFDYTNFDEIDQFWQYYEGNFTEDLKNGKGKLKFSNGQIFQGTFKQDMVEGQGYFYCRDGQRIHGVWSQNHLVQELN